MMKIGILGCGRIARKMTKTLRAMEAAGEAVQLYAVASRNQEKADAFAAEEGARVAYGSYEAMLQDPEVDLVYIATPHSHHYEQAKLCISFGKPVLCEKAFCVNAEQAREVLALAEEKKVFITEALWTRYMPFVKIVNEVIASGAIGQVGLVTADLCYSLEHKERLVEPELAGGALLDVGIYPINFALMFLGWDIQSVRSNVSLMDNGLDYTESMTLYYADGVRADLLASARYWCNRPCMICGTEGHISMDSVNCPSHIILHSDKDGTDREIEIPPFFTGYEYEIRACAKALAEGRLECPEITHAETIRLMELMDGLRQEWGLKYPCE